MAPVYVCKFACLHIQIPLSLGCFLLEIYAIGNSKQANGRCLPATKFSCCCCGNSILLNAFKQCWEKEKRKRGMIFSPYKGISSVRATGPPIVDKLPWCSQLSQVQVPSPRIRLFTWTKASCSLHVSRALYGTSGQAHPHPPPVGAAV